MPERDVVIIGASAGGIPALRLLLAGLPAGLPASVLVVVHTRAGTDRLPDVLACSPAMPRAALDRVPGAGVWPAAKLGWAIAEQVAAPAPPAIAPQFQPPYVKGIDEALWLAVSQLQMHAAAEQRLEQRFNASSLIAAQTRTSAARALHAANLITRHVLPLFQAGPLDSRYPAATAGRPY